MKYIKRRGIDSLKKVNLTLSEHIQPEDLGYKEAMIHAEWLLDEYVPSSSTRGKKWL